MAISKITTAPQPIEEVQKINEIIDGLDAKADDNAVVKLTGDQTVAGTKTFGGTLEISDGTTAYLKMSNTAHTKGTAPSEDVRIANISFMDSTGIYDNRYGNITAFSRPDESRISINLVKPVAGNTDNAGINLVFKPDGTSYVLAPAGGRTSHSILTHEAGGSVQNPAYMHLGNGILIQWGSVTAGATQTVTLPKAFANTSYRVTVNASGTNASIYAASVEYVSTSSFKIHTSSGAASASHRWIAIGWA